MKFLKLITSYFVIGLLSPVFSSEESVSIEIGENPYYEISDYDQMEYIKDARFFEPRSFWQQDIKDQMLYLKDEILGLDLLKIVKKRYDDPTSCLRHSMPTASLYDTKTKYSEDIEKSFQKSVWEKLRVFMGIDWKTPLTMTPGDQMCFPKADSALGSRALDHKKRTVPVFEGDFYKSLVKNISSESHLYSAPLLVHFSDHLCPRYETHYEDARVKKIIRLPSEFEELVGMGKEPELVYERGSGIIPRT